jgi:hypothetical protein
MFFRILKYKNNVLLTIKLAILNLHFNLLISIKIILIKRNLIIIINSEGNMWVFSSLTGAYLK